MLKTILSLFHEGMKLVDREEFDFSKVESLPVLQELARCKEVAADDVAKFEAIRTQVAKEVSGGSS